MTTWASYANPASMSEMIRFSVNDTHDFTVTPREARETSDYRDLIARRLAPGTWAGMPVHDPALIPTDSTGGPDA